MIVCRIYARREILIVSKLYLVHWILSEMGTCYMSLNSKYLVISLLIWCMSIQTKIFAVVRFNLINNIIINCLLFEY